MPVFLKLKKKLYFLLHLTFKETKMSWKNYIDELMATGDLAHAGIYGLRWCTLGLFRQNIFTNKNFNSKF